MRERIRKKKRKHITMTQIPGLLAEDISKTVSKTINNIGDGVYLGLKTILNPFSDKKNSRKIQKKSNWV